jgi:hypothetical protein
MLPIYPRQAFVESVAYDEEDTVVFLRVTIHEDEASLLTAVPTFLAYIKGESRFYCDQDDPEITIRKVRCLSAWCEDIRRCPPPPLSRASATA